MEEGTKDRASGSSEKEEKAKTQSSSPKPNAQIPETGGPKHPNPTRYGDWEINGKCVDF